MSYRENRWFEVCCYCTPEITEHVKPFAPRVCPEHLKEVNDPLSSLNVCEDGI